MRTLRARYAIRGRQREFRRRLLRPDQPSGYLRGRRHGEGPRRAHYRVRCAGRNIKTVIIGVACLRLPTLHVTDCSFLFFSQVPTDGFWKIYFFHNLSLLNLPLSWLTPSFFALVVVCLFPLAANLRADQTNHWRGHRRSDSQWVSPHCRPRLLSVYWDRFDAYDHCSINHTPLHVSLKNNQLAVEISLTVTVVLALESSVQPEFRIAKSRG